MTALYLDTETYSALDLKKVGTYHYAEHCEVMLIQYAVDDGPVHMWDHNGGQPPPDLAAWVEASGARVVAHNAMFDRNVLSLGNLRMEIPIERWECTMVHAMQHALPGNMDELGRVLGLPEDQRKLKEGKRLIQRFCKPAPSNHKADRYTRETHPDEWERFVAYGVQDVVTLREFDRRLPDWNWQRDDIDLYHLDQRINDRGFKVDTDLVSAGARAADVEKQALARRFGELTGGLKPTQRDKVIEHINARYGLNLAQTAKSVIEPLSLDESLPADLRELFGLMLSANRTSTAKYAALAAAVCDDGRFRGGLQMAGASRTRRWAGRLFQPQNLPSRGLPKEMMVNAYIEALKSGYHTELFEDLMLYGSAALRGVVIA